MQRCRRKCRSLTELQNVSCETALDAALRSCNLDWCVDEETVVITTRDAANCRLVTRVYPVRDLIKVRPTRDRADDADSLINIITSTVAAPTWDQVGGQGSAEYFAPAGTLLISQTRDVHDQIGKLLAVLRQARDEQGLHRRSSASGSAAVGHALPVSPASTRNTRPPKNGINRACINDKFRPTFPLPPSCLHCLSNYKSRYCLLALADIEPACAVALS